MWLLEKLSYKWSSHYSSIGQHCSTILSIQNWKVVQILNGGYKLIKASFIFSLKFITAKKKEEEKGNKGHLQYIWRWNQDTRTYIQFNNYIKLFTLIILEDAKMDISVEAPKQQIPHSKSSVTLWCRICKEGDVNLVTGLLNPHEYQEYQNVQGLKRWEEGYLGEGWTVTS